MSKILLMYALKIRLDIIILINILKITLHIVK